jgi:hypothetical protein
LLPAAAADECSMGERRRDDRLLCAELVQVNYRSASGYMQRTIANLEDISFCGLCLQLETPVPLDSKVVIQYGDGELIGTARHCVFRDGGYFLGIEFTEGCRWSTLNFRPKHLINPRELVEGVLSRRELN